MRRKEREITDRTKIDEIINEAEYATLALSSDGRPYAVPVSHIYDGKSLYFHCAYEGLKIDLIKQNPQVAFNLVTGAKYHQNAEKNIYTMHYNSVSGWGTASVVTNLEEKKKALILLKDKFLTIDFEFTPQIIDCVNIVKIRIDEIYGKYNDRT